MAPEQGRTYEKTGTLAARANASAPLLFRTRLVFLWAEVAIEQELVARLGRAQLVRAHAVGETPYKLKAELQPAMIAVASCAHSLDALYAELAEFVAPATLAEWEAVRRHGRWSEIAGLLALAVDADVTAWRPRLKNLFVKLRNPAVHPKVNATPPVKHPALGLNVAPEYATYCVEAVKDSVDLLLLILSTCVEAPRPSIGAWADDSRPVVDQLNELRADMDAVDVGRLRAEREAAAHHGGSEVGGSPQTREHWNPGGL